MNGFTANALTRNALTRNALTVNALTANALTADALTANAVTRGSAARVRNPGTPQLRRQLCSPGAGPRRDRSRGRVSSFRRRARFGSEWGQARGSCDQRCQESVSACLLARVNYLGEHIQISLRGKSRALSTTKEERETYETPEATYYGNVFLAEQRRFACLPPGATSIPRVCGPSLDGCVVDVVGACDEVCEHTSPDGSYWNCHDHAPVEGARCSRLSARRRRLQEVPGERLPRLARSPCAPSATAMIAGDSRRGDYCSG